MLTRRENLLIRPWQQRRYNNHLRKVQSALPAIDVGPPPTRGHVCCKLKKLQWEEERCAQIEEDNFRLLQRMGSIMRKNRLDNHWITAPPNFLHRVGIYYQPQERLLSFPEVTPESATPEEISTRKGRCLACSPHKARPTKHIPEERVPWEPPRMHTFRTPSSSTTITTQDLSSESPSKSLRSRVREMSTHRLTLSRGALHLSVNFPPHMTVKLQDNQRDRVLQREYCECKAIQPQPNI